MNALILHGTANDHTGNWFQWLKKELEEAGLKVWVPDLPQADRPNVQRYTDFLLAKNWNFSNSLVIGHSAGAVEVLKLLESLPDDVQVDTAIMVAVFKGDLGWDVLSDLKDVQYDFEKIKSVAKNFIVIHSDDDPYCPIKDAREIAKKLDAKFIEMHKMKHFSKNTDPRFTKFPELLEIIRDQVL
jgi:predicted alpha/beta hydrolase family esterase